MKRTIELPPGTKIANLGGKPPRLVLTLLCIYVSVFILYAFADGPAWVALYLGASAETTLKQLQFYQPFTALLLHLSTRPLLFNMLSLWIFGSALERWWGARRLLLFLLVTGVVGLWCGVWVGLMQPKVLVAGPGGATLAMMLAVAMIFPHHMVFFFGLVPIKTRIFALAILGFVLLGNLLGNYWLEVAVEVGGLLAALPFLSPPRFLSSLRRKRAQRKFEVVQGGKGKKDEPHYWN